MINIIYLFILMILVREGDTPEGASPSWKEEEFKWNEMKAGNPSQTQKIGQYYRVLKILESS